MLKSKIDPRSQAGFTMIDIMLIVVIMGVVLAFAVPGLRRSRSNFRLDEAVSTVVAELRASRTYARSESRPVVIDLDSSARTLTVKIDRNDDGTFASGEQSVVNISSANGITVSTPVTTGTFSPRGSFNCAQSVWKITVASTSAGTEYVYAFAGGLIERSEESL
jgi:type II secretion system protein H